MPGPLDVPDSPGRPRRAAAALFLYVAFALTLAPAVVPRGSVALAQPASAPLADYAAVLAAHAMPAAQLSILIADAESGRELFALQPDLPLNPASNTKIVTAAAALALLGPARTFTTQLAGRIAADAIVGPVVLVGGGDPSLDEAGLFALARELRARGITRVDGGVLVDDTALGAEHLPPAFEQQPAESAAFRAAVSAAAVDESALTLRIAPAGSVGAGAIVAVDPPGYAVVDNAVRTTANGAARIRIETDARSDGRERVRVTGSLPLDAAPAMYLRRLEHPSLAAGFALRAALTAAGIRVDGAVRVGARPADAPRLASRTSAPLSALLYEVGKDSNNMYAETLLLQLAAQDPGNAPVGFARGAERARSWLEGAGVATAGLVLRNGSGLFDANRLSARQLVGALRAAWRDPQLRDEYIAQLAVAGADGTLRTRLVLPAAPRRVRAKSGTLDDVSALSGFVLSSAPGRAVVFSVLANGIRGRQTEARALADALVVEIVRRTAP